MEGRQDLQCDEHAADERQRSGEGRPSVDGPDDGPGGDGQERGEEPAQDEKDPPGRREPGSGVPQGTEEAPFLTLSCPLDHVVVLATAAPPDCLDR